MAEKVTAGKISIYSRQPLMPMVRDMQGHTGFAAVQNVDDLMEYITTNKLPGGPDSSSKPRA
jgi:hypothetical protein